MTQQVPNPPAEIRPATPAGSRFVVLLGCLMITILAATNPAPLRAAWAEIERIIQLKGDPLPASPAKLSDHEIGELSSMAPQQQAQLLIERAINHYDGAIERIESNVPDWYGRLQVEKGSLAGLLNTAINANDLRVRAASLEIYLAAYNLPKTSASVDSLISRLDNEHDKRAWLLWILGVLGNRGVETSRVESVFLDRLHDPDEVIRIWSVVGLGLVATDGSITPLLTAFRDDPSGQVRERAACSLAQSGMFTPAQRLRAVPDLLRMTDDPTLDPATRGWVFQALRDITGASFGADPASWRTWWSQHGQG